MAEKKTEEKQESKFTKEQILASKKYADRRDVVGAVLSDKDTYSLKQVDSLLDRFMKGKVN